jgi:hypothetical protein
MSQGFLFQGEPKACFQARRRNKKLPAHSAGVFIFKSTGRDSREYNERKSLRVKIYNVVAFHFQIDWAGLIEQSEIRPANCEWSLKLPTRRLAPSLKMSTGHFLTLGPVFIFKSTGRDSRERASSAEGFGGRRVSVSPRLHPALGMEAKYRVLRTARP